jgi:hypothetical protein
MFVQIQLNLVAFEDHTGVWNVLFPFMDSPCNSLNVFCCLRSTGFSVVGSVSSVQFLKWTDVCISYPEIDLMS